MKKLTIILLVLILALSFASCGSESTDTPDDDIVEDTVSDSASDTPQDDPTSDLTANEDAKGKWSAADLSFYGAGGKVVADPLDLIVDGKGIDDSQSLSMYPDAETSTGIKLGATVAEFFGAYNSMLWNGCYDDDNEEQHIASDTELAAAEEFFANAAGSEMLMLGLDGEFNTIPTTHADGAQNRDWVIYITFTDGKLENFSVFNLVGKPSHYLP